MTPTSPAASLSAEGSARPQPTGAQHRWPRRWPADAALAQEFAQELPQELAQEFAQELPQEPAQEFAQAVEPATLVDLFEAAVRNHAERPAWASFGASLPFREIADHARAIASGLQRIGVKKGERIAILSPNVMASAPILFGALTGGFSAVIVDTQAPPDVLARQLNSSGARVVFALETCAHAIYAALEELEVLERAIIVAAGDLIGWRGALVNFSTRFVKRRVKPYTLPATLPFGGFVEWGAGQAPKPAGVERDDLALIRFADAQSSAPIEMTHAQAARAVGECAAWLSARLPAGAPGAIACGLPATTRTGLLLPLAAWHLGALNAALMDGGDPVELTKALTFAPADVLALDAAHYERLAAWAPAREPLKRVSLFLSESEPEPETARKWSQAFNRPIEPEDD